MEYIGLLLAIALISISACDTLAQDEIKADYFYAIGQWGKANNLSQPNKQIASQKDLTNESAGSSIKAFHPSQTREKNLALNTTATQINTYSSAFGSPDKAVDGNTNGDFFNGSVTHTSYDKQSNHAWLDIDLGSQKKISSIIIWGRTDCCINELKNYWIYASPEPFLTNETPDQTQRRRDVIIKVKGKMPEPYYALETYNVIIRHIRIQLDNPAGEGGVLSLAEIQVIGH